MKFFTSILLLPGIFALSLAACDKSEIPMPMPPLPEVTVVTAHAQTVPLTRDSVGLLASSRVAQVRARVAGIVLSRVYTEGTDVKQGQVLFQIDPAALQAALHAEEATLARAQAEAANAVLIAKRSQNLSDKGVLSSQELDTSLANQRTTAAAVKEAQANVEKARLDLGYATVTAPIAGRAGRAMVTEGALVGQDEVTQLTTVNQIDPIYVNFSQSASELQQLQQTISSHQAGDPVPSDLKVEILLPDGSLYPRPGKLNFSDLAVDPNTGAISLRAVVPNPEYKLLPGMFVKLRITIGQLEHAFLLPQATVLYDKTGPYVLVVDATGKVTQKRVQTHGMTLTDWIITGELAEDDQVISEGLQKVKPGAMAKAVLASPARSVNEL
ncbi:MAG: efflux RND transporter periplasmic adaptor subunit [Gammaproteobacteria bacterium]|nr:efflux RND transporter periplasmic adaptor subunit [Gammaproteobacteria bacterium]